MFCIFFLFAFQLVRSWKKIWKEHPEPVFMSIIAILTAPYMLGRTDLGHIVKGCMPAFFIGAYLLKKKLLLLIPISFIVVGLVQVYWSNNFYNTKVEAQNGIIRLNKGWLGNSVLVSAATVT